MQAKQQGRGPRLETSPTQTHTTHTDTNTCSPLPNSPSPAPRDLPWWFTWPGPGSPRGPAPESPCGLVSGSPLLPLKRPTHLAERVGLGAWQRPRWGQLSDRRPG